MEVSEKSMELLFSKYSYIYELTEQFLDICPKVCILCEEKENLLLLPYENEFINNRYINKKYTFHKTKLGYYSEPINKKCTMLSTDGRCKLHGNHPLDCRSFPLVPKFSIKSPAKVDFFIADSYCPICNELPDNFVFINKKCWQFIAEDIPNKWKYLYNIQNKHNYSTKI